MVRVLKTDPVSVNRRAATQRMRERNRLAAQGLPIPPELEKRPTRRSELTEEERKQRSRDAAARYRKGHTQEVNDALVIRRDRNRAIVLEAKQAPCQDCNQRFPAVCMDFDHREGEVKALGKNGGVARLVANGSAVETLKAEIAKCDLVCANCHRIRTAKKENWESRLYE